MKNIIYDQYRKLIRESKFRWLIILGSALYILSPVDLLPELFLPLVGFLDDGVVATVLVTEVTAILMEKIKEKKSPTSSSAKKKDDDDPIDVNSTRIK